MRKCYHPECFFRKYHPRSQFDIDGFAALNNDDQDRVKKLLGVFEIQWLFLLNFENDFLGFDLFFFF